MTKVTFLGLGAMGSRMAANLIAAGFELTVWNRTGSAAEVLKAAGARAAVNPREAAEGADVVIAMLTDDAVSLSVWTDEANGALAGMKAGAIAVEMSTVTPAWIAELSIAAGEVGIALVDAPVSGSLPQAEGRQLVVMAGGAAESVESVRPVLAAMGSVHRVGGSGQGAVLKLAVNALLGIQIAGWAELMVLLKKNGMDIGAALNLLTTMPVCSPAAAGMAKLMAAQDFAPRFTTALLAKDFRYLHQVADGAGTETPVSDAASQVFAKAAETMGGQNVTAVIRLYES
jgi:3-hydroxyisobutyrate dehydrogenase